MTTKLTAITPSYSSFEDDQVLTAKQLNTFLNYFDDQDRMSRVCLSGVGIVCGFKVDFTAAKQLILSQGCGITTDGDLIHLQASIPNTDGLKRIDIDEITYTKYASFSDDKAIYKPFFYKPDGSQINLWELFPADQPIDVELPISNLPNLEDKVVLLYLESYNEDADLCVGISCDNLGIREVQNLRVLLVSQDDAENILKSDKIFRAEDLFSTYMDLSDVVVPRVILDQNNTATFTALSDSYRKAITADYVVDNMKASFTAMLSKVDMDDEATLINSQLTALFGLSAVQPALYFQYRYDALKDVVDSYMEMKELFLNSSTNCCPDIHSFPKHLMLGKLIPTPEDTLYNNYRHSFYKSPLLGNGHEDYEMFKSMVDRVIQQLTTYISNSEIPKGEIKITPSMFRGPLEKKAIPFYYNFKNEMLNAWNYEKTRRNKQNRNLSYHTSLLSSAAAIQKPLKYNLEPYNFLRFEGHQGTLYQDAMEKIDAIKYANGLSFDLKALGITISPNETINIDDYQCDFEDLSAMLAAWKKENECAMGNASYYLSSYSVVRPGFNGREVTYLNPMKTKVDLSSLAVKSTVAVKQNPVQDNLDVEKDTMGKLVSDAFKTYDGCSASDIITHVNSELANYDFSTWDPVVYDTTINKPMELLAHSFLLINKLPAKLPDLTAETVANYSVNASNVCSLAKKVQAVSNGELYPSLPPSPNSLAVEPAKKYGDYNADYNADYSIGGALVKEPAMVNLLMNQLATVCCSVKKLESIMDEIEARKQRILLNLKLSKFIESHPGLEHYAGTEHGGTFVLVYITTSVSGIPANTVVADYSLPYLCCSDCSSVNFIMPKPVATLTLSQDRFCIGNDTGPLVFTPSPLDGVIKADQVVPGMTINGNQLLIDPALIPTSILGTPIYFTVNDQITGCHLTIYKSPQVIFNVPDSPVTNRQITFNPIGLFDKGTTFLWNFGDGTTSTQKVSTHEYAYPVNDENKVTVTLTVTPVNGACPTTVTHEISFLDYEVSIDPKVFCNGDTSIYPFTVTPPEADVVIQGNGVVKISDTEYGFNPSLASPGKVTIFVNDVPTLELTVNPNPQAKIVGKVDSKSLSLTSNMTNVEFFYWSFLDAKGDPVYPTVNKEPNPVIPLDKLSISTGAVTVKLYIQNACSSHTDELVINLPGDFNACSLKSASDIRSGMEEIDALMKSDEYGKLTVDQKSLVEGSYTLFKGVTEDITNVLKGNSNAAISKTLTNLLNKIHSEIVVIEGNGVDPEEQIVLDLLMKVYSLDAYTLFASILRCQNEELISKSTPVINLFDLIKGHLDLKNSESFGQMHIPIDAEYEDILKEVLDYRPIASYSWNSLNQLMFMIDASNKIA